MIRCACIRGVCVCVCYAMPLGKTLPGRFNYTRPIKPSSPPERGSEPTLKKREIARATEGVGLN